MIKRLHALLNSNCHSSIVFESTKKLERKAAIGTVANILYLFIFHLQMKCHNNSIYASLLQTRKQYPDIGSSITIEEQKSILANIFMQTQYHIFHLAFNYKTFHNFCLSVFVRKRKEER